MKSLLQELEVAFPLVQAPMAGVSTPELAAAVTNAGGLGSLGLGAMSAGDASEAIQRTARLTSGPFHVNVFCHQAAVRDPASEAAWLAHLSQHFAKHAAPAPECLAEIYLPFQHNRELQEVLLDLGPPLVSFHFGLPTGDLIARLRSAGIRLMATATSLREAEAITAAGLDAIVAQGYEAGGHRGIFDPTSRDEQLSTAILTRILAQRRMLPVIASGGLMDGASLAAMQTLGAEAALLGTAFLACPESGADAAYRDALRNGGVTGTTMTRAISGRPARALNNAFTALGGEAACPRVPDYPIAYSAGKALHAAAQQRGSSQFAAHWAGQAVMAIRPMPAAELVATLMQELKEAPRSVRARQAGRGADLQARVPPINE